MKKIIILIIFWFDVSNLLFAQVDSVDYKNLYIRAICAMIDSIPKIYGKIPPDKDFNNFIIQKNEEIIKSLPSHLKGVTISYLTIEELKLLTIKINKAIPIMLLRPIKNDHNLIEVSFSNYSLDYSRFRKKTEKKILNYALGGGYQIYFKYDCLTNDFIVYRVVCWGI